MMAASLYGSHTSCGVTQFGGLVAANYAAGFDSWKFWRELLKWDGSINVGLARPETPLMAASCSFAVL